MVRFALEPIDPAVLPAARWRALERRAAPSFFESPGIGSGRGSLACRPRAGRIWRSAASRGGRSRSACWCSAGAAAGASSRSAPPISTTAAPPPSGHRRSNITACCSTGRSGPGCWTGLPAGCWTAWPTSWCCPASGPRRCAATGWSAGRSSSPRPRSTWPGCGRAASLIAPACRRIRAIKFGARCATTRRTGRRVIQPADSLAQALSFWDRLAVLHLAYWQGRGRPGAFAAPFFGDLHRRIIAAGFVRGAVQLLRISAGGREIGYLYNLVRDGRVAAYQSGFAYESTGRRKPGLISHVLAIEHNLAAGAARYDFLAGLNQMKQSLATDTETLSWNALQHRSFGALIEQRRRSLKSRLNQIAAKHFRIL
ncbi:MAG: GNAT family N-acetyltransferase [Pseudomonadota bacterium]